MTTDELIYFLKSEPMKFSYAEIEQMMDEELAKDPDEMDTDFVDLCVDVLYNALQEAKQKEAENNSKNNKRIKFKWARIIVAAIIAALILCTAVSVTAKYVHNETSDKIVKFYENHFSINLRNGETCSEKYSDENIELITKLKDSGFDNVILPSVLLEDDYTYDINVTENEDFVTALVDFYNVNNDTVINVTITKHNNSVNNFLDSDTLLSNTYDSAKQLSINQMDIFVLGNNKESTILYVDNNIEYDLSLSDYNFNSAIEIAKTIE